MATAILRIVEHRGKPVGDAPDGGFPAATFGLARGRPRATMSPPALMKKLRAPAVTEDGRGPLDGPSLDQPEGIDPPLYLMSKQPRCADSTSAHSPRTSRTSRRHSLSRIHRGQEADLAVLPEGAEHRVDVMEPGQGCVHDRLVHVRVAHVDRDHGAHDRLGSNAVGGATTDVTALTHQLAEGRLQRLRVAFAGERRPADPFDLGALGLQHLLAKVRQRQELMYADWGRSVGYCRAWTSVIFPPETTTWTCTSPYWLGKSWPVKDPLFSPLALGVAVAAGVLPPAGGAPDGVAAGGLLDGEGDDGGGGSATPELRVLAAGVRKLTKRIRPTTVAAS